MPGSSAKRSEAKSAAEKELTFTRVVDAPREVVFKAWTDAENLAQWWGPHGFTNPVCELDARPGGALRIHMRGPDGVVYPNSGDGVAFSHGLNRVKGIKRDGGELDMWWRATVCYHKIDGAWRITHEHSSVPFDMTSGKASLDLKP